MRFLLPILKAIGDEYAAPKSDDRQSGLPVDPSSAKIRPISYTIVLPRISGEQLIPHGGVCGSSARAVEILEICPAFIGVLPELFARGGVETINDVVVPDIAHCKGPVIENGNGRVADPEIRFPRDFWISGKWNDFFILVQAVAFGSAETVGRNQVLTLSGDCGGGHYYKKM